VAARNNFLPMKDIGRVGPITLFLSQQTVPLAGRTAPRPGDVGMMWGNDAFLDERLGKLLYLGQQRGCPPKPGKAYSVIFTANRPHTCKHITTQPPPHPQTHT
jgi:hypothetical protein